MGSQVPTRTHVRLELPDLEIYDEASQSGRIPNRHRISNFATELIFVLLLYDTMVGQHVFACIN